MNRSNFAAELCESHPAYFRYRDR